MSDTLALIERRIQAVVSQSNSRSMMKGFARIDRDVITRGVMPSDTTIFRIRRGEVFRPVATIDVHHNGAGYTFKVPGIPENRIASRRAGGYGSWLANDLDEPMAIIEAYIAEQLK